MKNNPYVAEWMNENVRRERLDIAIHIEAALKFRNYQVNNIEYFKSGNSCVVGKLSLIGKLEPLVIKARKGDLDKEYEFLRLVDGRIPAPISLDYFKYEGYCFLVINYIDSKMLYDYSKSTLLKGNVFFRLGNMLESIHAIEYKDTSIPIDGKKMLKKALYKTTSIINGIGFTASEAMFIKKSIEYCDDKFSPVLCHGDFHDKNIFYDGEKITIIDPSPKINDKHLDVAYFLSVYSTIQRKTEVFKQILGGYQNEGRNLNEENLIYAYCIALLVRLGQFNRKRDSKKYFQIISEIKKVSGGEVSAILV
jgi:hypothetical protein